MSYTLIFQSSGHLLDCRLLCCLGLGGRRGLVVALPGAGGVLAEGGRRGDLEFFEVELAHLVQAEAVLALAEGEERHLKGGAPAEAEVDGEVALHLVHHAQTGRGVLKALPAAQKVGRPGKKEKNKIQIYSFHAH
eukprot:scaffold307571_cov44-Prasinocladus_malaysianus.AAC.1